MHKFCMMPMYGEVKASGACLPCPLALSQSILPQLREGRKEGRTAQYRSLDLPKVLFACRKYVYLEDGCSEKVQGWAKEWSLGLESFSLV